MCVFVCLFGLDSLWSKRPYWLMEELEVITESLKKKKEEKKVQYLTVLIHCQQRRLLPMCTEKMCENGFG